MRLNKNSKTPFPISFRYDREMRWSDKIKTWISSARLSTSAHWVIIKVAVVVVLSKWCAELVPCSLVVGWPRTTNGSLSSIINLAACGTSIHTNYSTAAPEGAPRACPILRNRILCCFFVSWHFVFVWGAPCSSIGAFAFDLVHLLNDDSIEVKGVLPEDQGHDYLNIWIIQIIPYIYTTYPEEEWEVWDSKREVTNAFLDTSILSIVTLVLKEEPDKVIYKWDKNTENQGSESPFSYFISVIDHVNGCSADGQVQKVSAEKQHKASKYCLNGKYDLSKCEPRHMREA